MRSVSTTPSSVTSLELSVPATLSGPKSVLKASGSLTVTDQRVRLALAKVLSRRSPFGLPKPHLNFRL